MSRDQSTVLSPAEALKVLVAHRRLWLVPALVCGVLATLVAVVTPRAWQASQAVAVRNEATSNDNALGRFRELDDMKTAQETVLELAKSRVVLEAALREAGPATSATPAWPTQQAVADFREAVTVVPPKGAEFGKTEVFYVQVKDRDADRAILLATALCRQLQHRVQQLRDEKAGSMIDELAQTETLAERDLTAATGRLTKLESEVGGDLAELRLLNGATNGDSELRRKTVEIEAELRAARTARRESQELLKLLKAAEHDPGHLLATPSRLLESQPALRRLKDGLVDAQLRTAQMSATMTSAHPLVVAAVDNERNVAGEVHRELATAVRGVQVDLDLTQARVAALEAQSQDCQSRLERLAGARASYANLAAEVTQRAELLQQARMELAEARASKAGAAGASVITLIDTPDVGDRPVGVGRTAIVLGGVVGGLGIGLGLVFLTVPIPYSPVTSTAATAKTEKSIRQGLGLRGALESLAQRGWGMTAGSHG